MTSCIKTMFYRYECPVCGNITCRTTDIPDFECPVCSNSGKMWSVSMDNLIEKKVRECIQRGFYKNEGEE